MKLYLLKRIGECDYDEADGFVVRAKSPQGARKIIAEDWDALHPDSRLPWFGEEGSEPWLNPALTTCQELHADGKPGVVLRDFLHG